MDKRTANKIKKAVRPLLSKEWEDSFNYGSEVTFSFKQDFLSLAIWTQDGVNFRGHAFLGAAKIVDVWGDAPMVLKLVREGVQESVKALLEASNP